jgi:hypothetical protein
VLQGDGADTESVVAQATKIQFFKKSGPFTANPYIDLPIIGLIREGAILSGAAFPEILELSGGVFFGRGGITGYDDMKVAVFSWGRPQRRRRGGEG